MKGCSVVLLGCAVLSCAGDTGRPEEIALEPLATIGADDGTGRYASMPLASEQLSDGRYFVTEPWGPAPQLVRIHDADGRYVQRQPTPDKPETALGTHKVLMDEARRDALGTR